MAGQTETRQWIVANKPVTDPVLAGPDATFALKTTTLPAPKPNEVLLKTLYFSNDPAQRGWIQKDIDPERLYTKPVDTNEPMRCYGIFEVVEVGSASKLQKGQLVTVAASWTEYVVVPEDQVQVIDTSSGIAPTRFIGAFGGPGMTAYYGLIEIVRCSKDDSMVVVSGAAGATGSIAVQIAKKVVGVKHVVGIAGSDGKCRWVESLGADVCVNYKKPSFEEDLKKATEGFADVFFDNVGGEILDLMLSRMKRYGRIAACGAVSTYNRHGQPVSMRHWYEIISNRLEVRGFIVTDAVLAGKGLGFVQKLTQALKEGKLKLDEGSETIVETKFEDVPKTWMMLFESKNQGKLITKLI
ncbi:MAG: hypothetical protein M1821_007202 [Bathelium mastoideum]|nr:MAG: hypothetical protein M1821_007202 [Bathelium mastoideum]